ncbi:MAG: hypothetical protein EDQ89_10825 [Acidobacteria bacterium]|nr:MAG: hypothetical protein EDQ89_10825 [Acidobacteriota bacterium]
MRQAGEGLLSAVVGSARPVAVDAEAGTLTIAFPPDSAFNLRKADGKESREAVAGAIATVLGVSLRPVFTMLDRTEHEPEAAPVGEDDLFERFVAEFDAEIVIDEEPEQPEQAEERIEETS